MIKINLLPKSINHKAILRNTALLFVFLLVVIIGAGVGYGINLQGQVTAMEEQATQAETIKAEVEKIQQATQAEREKIKPMQAKLDFINSVLEYNKQYPKLYSEISKWTYGKVVLDSMSCNGTDVELKAKVKSLDDLGRYLLNMYQASDLFTEVTIADAAGFVPNSTLSNVVQDTFSTASDVNISGSKASLAGIDAIGGGVVKGVLKQQSWITFTVKCKLKNPIAAPAFGGQSNSPGTGDPAAPSMPSSQPSVPGGVGDPMEQGMG